MSYPRLIRAYNFLSSLSTLLYQSYKLKTPKHGKCLDFMEIKMVLCLYCYKDIQNRKLKNVDTLLEDKKSTWKKHVRVK